MDITILMIIGIMLVVLAIIVLAIIAVSLKNIEDDISYIMQTCIADIAPDVAEIATSEFKKYMGAKLDIKEKYNVNLDTFCAEYISEYNKRAEQAAKEEINNGEEDE